MVGCKSCCVSVTSSIIQPTMTNSNDKMNEPDKPRLLACCLVGWNCSPFWMHLSCWSLITPAIEINMQLLTAKEGLCFVSPDSVSWLFCWKITLFVHHLSYWHKEKDEQRLTPLSRCSFHSSPWVKTKSCIFKQVFYLLCPQVQMALISPVKLNKKWRNKCSAVRVNCCGHDQCEHALGPLQGSTV